ncbi:MAG: ATP-dependent endonuclease [Eggerthellaceae bacterium]|nr:ATP-dependent endonuclease [Eggerthellaceae bacterium]
MKIERAQVKNFRILKELDVDFEDNLSLVIGKNNSGKTSFLAILEKFLVETKPVFSLDDFNIESQKAIVAFETSSFVPEDFCEISLSLKLYISYEDTDDIGNASELILDLDTENHHLVILFEHVIVFEKYKKLLTDYAEYRKNGVKRNFEYFVSQYINKYFVVRIRALEYGNEENSKTISGDIVKSVISMETIEARRDVDNEQGRGKSLSTLANRYYNANMLSDADFPELQEQLLETDEKLTNTYKKLFHPVVQEIMKMSYNPQEAEIAILSSLSDKRLFQDNTTVKYKHEDTLLPEDYNGLGYLNLFAIIFNIRIKLDRLAKKNKPDESPTPVNLLFIEEPEAHTHPQMQYVFITNIKRILALHQEKLPLQTIISTHSSHIVSQCNFDDIKYFFRATQVSVVSRSLKNLYSQMVNATDAEEKAQQERRYRFVKQYVSLSRAELFFADKAVLIEGDTERMLMTAIMKKIDTAHTGDEGYVPLLSQNVSTIEVGAYAHVFATFLGFLSIKTLIVTDLDCASSEDNNKSKRFSDADITSNASIVFFLGTKKLDEIVATTNAQRTFSYALATSTWSADKNGVLRVAFQTEENSYQASSFEDAFFCKNTQFLVDSKTHFTGLKNLSSLTAENTDYYALAKDCINSKTSFALDILLYGGDSQEKWEIPLYIKEGLEWLAQ